MKGSSFVVLLVALLAVLIGSQTLYVVKETERAVVLKFGEIVEADVQPGLHFKIPVMNDIKKFDARILTMDSRPQRYLTLEKKAVIVDSYVKWKIANVSKFYQATSGDEFVANRVLSSRVDTGLRNQFGERTMHEVVSGERDELMTELRDNLDEVAKNELGITIVDIRVKKIDLPPNVSESVYQRMRTEREREAREHRSKGLELAEGIRADADRQKVVLEAEAQRDAEMIRGDGDAQAAAVYAKAYTQDPEFFEFYRSLQAYRESFSKKGDLFLLKPDSEFFKYLNGVDGVTK
ncbi:protease modulator HflC [Marinomonas mediterranea]|jgi:protease FtsH subunit HflC|uniref:Protein HflC n=1 Tax=Marinomonas mediterranea (strain ATCC 700492 / JCM 21426 / NBRC 103028 / MMB-1) TaxID=717774 RepID=F2JWL3_MARM1|nr:protease modulator HflC [Marinomonas mediterranea]ADZ91777.1 HflC protein [Marinomonas mediterranea MMB-1]WCN09733.1 protease modulator HflC [Marinomonas mediterranea]WCN13814.1 protease modulator HflC [Marinomonas mediterranea]WCN17870.1 protease modulator HflC [Marinomonas mediterranea MMB-1]